MGEPEPIVVDIAQLADIEIEELGLSALINDHLAVCHIATAADLCQMLQRLPGVVPLFIRRHICFFDRCIDEVIQNIDTHGDFDLLAYHGQLATWSDLFAICDENVPASLYPDLVHLMHDVLSSEDDAREWQIFSKRYGIAGEAPHTLEELGTNVHLTRACTSGLLKFCNTHHCTKLPCPSCSICYVQNLLVLNIPITVIFHVVNRSINISRMTELRW